MPPIQTLLSSSQGIGPMAFEKASPPWRIFMGSKLYVGNLPFSITEQSLKDLFAGHGSVASARIITDRDTGRSKGFGFVEMGSDDEAQGAIESLNGQEYEGRKLVVNEARPQEPRTGGFGGGGGRGGDRGGRGGFGGGGNRY